MNPLLYIAMAFGYGYARAVGFDTAKNGESLLTTAFDAAKEEAEFRFLLEDWLLGRAVGLDPTVARIAATAAFALVHPGHQLDAAVGGLLYSYAYRDGGFLAASAAHFAHNLGVELGSK